MAKKKCCKKKTVVKKQSSSRASTLAAQIMSGAIDVVTTAQLKLLAASVLSQDETKGQG